MPAPLPEGPWHVSASQFQTYQSCPRKWFFEKRMGLARPEAKYFALGTEIHGEMEVWLKGGPEPAHAIARAGMHLCPAPSPDLLIEHEMDPPLVIAGAEWVGRIDLLAPPSAGSPAPLVLDHKTTKNFSYCKSPVELAAVPQMVSYAYYAALRFYGPGCFQRKLPVRLSHIYYHSAPESLLAGAPRAKRVDSVLETDKILATWNSYTPTVERLLRDVLAGSPDDVEPDPDACREYGGCPFRGRCSMNSAPKTVVNLLGLGAKKPPLAPKPVPVLVQPAAQEPTQGASEGTVQEPEGLALYIDCIPCQGVQARPIEAVIAEHSQALCEAQGVADLRLVAYGQGPGLLSASLRAEPPVGAFYGASTGLNGAAFDALIPLATTVVRGLR